MLAVALELLSRTWNGPFSRPPGGRLAVGFLAVEDALDLEGAVLFAEEDAVVLSAETDHGRGDALELLGSAFAGK